MKTHRHRLTLITTESRTIKHTVIGIDETLKTNKPGPSSIPSLASIRPWKQTLQDLQAYILITIKVSKMTKVSSQALYKKNKDKGKEEENKWVFRRFLKTWREGDVMTCCGRLFHTRDTATGNDRLPTVVRRVRRTTSIDDDAERSLHRARESAGRLSSTTRYGGADPWTFEHEYSEFKVNLFLCLQPGKLMEKRSDVIKPRWVN